MFEVWGGFAFGLLGSLHCAGMCGPIAFALPYNRNNWFTAFLGNYLYQFGRILTYAVLGLLIGLVGRGFSFSGLSQALSVGVGSIMIIFTLLPQIKPLHRLNSKITMWVGRVKSEISIYITKKSYKAFFITGLLNGLLPCGLVYMALVGALGTGSALRGSLFMALFGVGTFPMMFAIGYAGNFLTPALRQKFRKVVPVFVVAIGLLFVLRGLGLGIPYISPSNNSLNITPTEVCH